MNIQEVILNATKYIRKKGELRFSASMFGNTDLQNFLTIIYGAEDSKEIGQSEIGSIAHIGMQTIINNENNPNILTEEDFIIENYENTGWNLTGTADVVEHVQSLNTLRIDDYKFTKVYAGKSVKKEPLHAYRKQLNVLKILAVNKYEDIKNFNMFLDMFYKDADPLKGEQAFEQIEVDEITDMKEMLVDKITALDVIIKSGDMPPECATADQWIRKLKNGNVVKSRCEVYCSVKHVCPYYTAPSAKTQVSNW